MHDRVVVWDEYDIAHSIQIGQPLYEEALRELSEAQSTAEASDQGGSEVKLIWPLQKIMRSRGWGWWSVYKKLEEFEEDLEKLVPHPGKQRLLKLEDEYTPTELSDLLQQFGSYLATIHHLEGMLEAQCHALKEGFKTGLSVATAQYESKQNTVSGKEAEVLAGNELLKETKRMQINQEACLLLIKGWREAYQAAWDSTSRIISLRQGELSLQTGRHA